MEQNIIQYLKFKLKNKGGGDLPCYTNPIVQDEFRNKIMEACDDEIANTEIVKILAPLTDNLNAKDVNGWTPIVWAAFNGHTDIVKLLAPLTDNPNARDVFGWTPISVAKTGKIRRILKEECKNAAKRKNKISAQSTTKRTKKI